MVKGLDICEMKSSGNYYKNPQAFVILDFYSKSQGYSKYLADLTCICEVSYKSFIMFLKVFETQELFSLNKIHILIHLCNSE